MNARTAADQGIPIPWGKGYRRPVEFRVLGSIEVFEEGNGSIALGGPKQRAVLAHLLLRANHLVPADVLIDEVWGEEPPETARNALQSYASHLRKALGAERLEGSRAGYRLRAEPSELDAIRFQSLLRDARRLLPIDARAAVGAFDHALALWRGPAFADLAAEPSLRAEAARLEDLRLGALEDRIEAQLTIGNHGEVIGELEGLTTHHPLRERFWQQLMLALYRSGRQAEALAAFQRAREVLADELGIDPARELRRLHERILAQSPDLDASGEPLRGYRLLERLGEDSFGVLYRATQPNVGREVGVRVVHEHRANDPAFIRRFDAEAQAVAALEHPHVAPVYDYWREPGRAYVVTRFMRGGNLREQIDSPDGLAPERATRILEQIASALAAAHRRGVAHGDLTLSNVLFDEEGNAYLTDFSIGSGAARMVNDVRAFALLARETLGERLAMATEEALLRAEDAKSADQASSLLGEVVTTLGAGTVAPATMGAEIRNPYKGLRPFLESDAGDFFGREAFVERLLGRLSRRGDGARFVAVVGPSGSGKSSVVSAGLVAAIRGGAFPGSERWFVTDMHPGHHPFEELDAALMRVAVRPPAGLLARLESGPRGLFEVANAIVPGDTELLLVVDQFEELFTLTESEDDRALLLESLRVATADPASRVHVIATLRADFYDRPLRYPRMGPLLGSTTEVLSPLTPEELERAIVRPAERSGLLVDSALVPQIAADVAEQPGALPLVQYALTELYDRREDGRLTLEAYRDMGGVGGALAASAEHLYATRNANGREAVRQLFLRLVTLGEGRADTRRRVTLSELSTLEVDESAMEWAIDAYGRHRLLTFDRDPATREPTVEVAHEALLGAWERLNGWIDQARDDVRMHRRLSEAAREWESSRREASFLLTGSRLEQFEAWGSATSLALGLEERGYLTASIARREEDRSAETARRDRERLLERRSVKRLRGLVAVFAVAALVAASLTVVAKNQSDRAVRESRIAQARELAAASNASLGDDVERSLLLAIEAVETTYELDGTVLPEAQESLHLALQAHRLEFQVSGGPYGRLSPDGSRLLTLGTDPGTAVLYDTRTGAEVLTIGPHGTEPLRHIQYSPDGRYISTSSWQEASTKIWDAVTGAELYRLTVPSGDPVCCGALFSPDSSVVASMVFDGTTRIWDLANGEELNVLHSTGSLAFSPDGSRLWIDTCVGIWRQPDGGPNVLCVPGNEGGVTDASWNPDGSSVATSGWEGTVILWDPLTGEEIATLVPGGSGYAWDIEFSPDGTRLAMGFSDGTASVWDLTETAAEEALELAGHESLINSQDFSADGTRLATASLGGLVNVWDVTPQGGTEWLAVHGAGGFAYSPDGEMLAVGGRDGTVVLRDARTGAQIREMRHGAKGLAVAFDPDGVRIATAGNDGTVVVWDAATGMELLRFRAHSGANIDDVGFSPDGTTLATTSSETKTTILWDPASGKRIDTFGAGNLSIAFNPDGIHLAGTSAEGSGDAQRSVFIWDVTGGAMLRLLPDALWTNALVFTPDGSRLVTGGADGLINVWDPVTGVGLGSVSVSGGEIWDMAFSPDGSLLATASGDGIVRLWDFASRRELYKVADTGDFSGPGFEVEFSPDGTRLAASAADGTRRILILPIDELLRVAKSRVIRGFTDQECRQFLHLERCPSELAS